CISSGDSSHRRVEPSTSVNKKVTIPEGSSATPTPQTDCIRQPSIPGGRPDCHEQRTERRSARAHPVAGEVLHREGSCRGLLAHSLLRFGPGGAEADVDDER